MWGKAKIAVLLRREGGTASESTVGRILRRLMDRGQIQRVPDRRRTAVRTARSRRPWAKRRRSGLRPDAPGEVVQMDTPAVTPKHGRPAVKQSAAVDPVAKWTCSHAFRNATARNGREFLRKALRDMPFDVKAIQVDGGSEFKAEFEAECEAGGIDLWVLPPKSPELNGCIERTNGTWRCEFHGCWELEYEDLVKMNRCIDAFADEFNRVRPHRSLGGLTPEQTLEAAA